MTSDEADDAADWKSMDGGEAFALIERHANDFDDANELMNAWARTRVKAEREACAAICDELESFWSAEKDVALLNGDVALSNASSGEPRAARAIAQAIRARGTA
jgi:hypothetical protein